MAGFAKAMMPDCEELGDVDTNTNNLVDYDDEGDDEEMSEDVGEDDD
jgi:hypothetical protein